jgi:hypothetical protein
MLIDPKFIAGFSSFVTTLNLYSSAFSSYFFHHLIADLESIDFLMISVLEWALKLSKLSAMKATFST